MSTKPPSISLSNAAFDELSKELTRISAMVDNNGSLIIVDRFVAWRKDPAKFTLNDIIDMVCTHFGGAVTRAEVFGQRREQAIVKCRHTAIALYREATGYSTARIGEDFSTERKHVMDHGTVCHALKNVKNRRETEKDFDKDYNQLIAKIKP